MSRQLLDKAQGLYQQGRFSEAETVCRQILEDEAGNGEALNLLGIVLVSGGRAADGVEALEQAVAVEPDIAAFRSNLGNVLSSQGRLEAAVRRFQEALSLQPDYAFAHNNLGTVLRRLGRFEEAASHFGRAAALQPSNAGVHSNLANTLIDMGRTQQALEACRRALELNPAAPEALNGLGVCMKRLGRYGEAETAFRQALEAAPRYADALGNLGQARLEMGEAEEALDCLRKALEAEPGRSDIHSNLLLALNSVATVSRAEVFAEHQKWSRRFSVQSAAPASASPPDRPLRIGYVSPDFRRHSVASFIEPVLESHDAAAFEVFCYANIGEEDEVTVRLRALAAGWCNIRDLDDAAAAQKIRDDGIDILVDLSGHTTDNRLALFALRPAPVQLTWLGYPNTTGLAAIDFRITDNVADPPDCGCEAYYSEKLARLAGGFLCYRPPADAPAPVTPAAGDGPVVFGSCNNLSKVTPQVVAAWARILEACPHSLLLLKSKALGDQVARVGLAARFAAHGIAAERLEMMGWVTSGSHLDVYRDIDIALDTFPYNGTTTTCEALWMQTPLITVAGDRHAARVGASLLEGLGLGELVAADVDGYVRFAVDLAGDRHRLNALSGGLRERMATSRLLDEQAFTRELEAAYRQMVIRHSM